jgi:hypothetical protein
VNECKPLDAGVVQTILASMYAKMQAQDAAQASLVSKVSQRRKQFTVSRLCQCSSDASIGYLKSRVNRAASDIDIGSIGISSRATRHPGPRYRTRHSRRQYRCRVSSSPHSQLPRSNQAGQLLYRSTASKLSTRNTSQANPVLDVLSPIGGHRR